MATGRIGATPVLRVRWSKLPTTGTTVLSGLDDNSVALVYDAGYEAVYRNGVLLSRGNDYTATNGTTVTLIDATLAGDIIEILANDLVPLTDAISKGQFTAKGALLSATAASTPGVLAVGANDTVLTADSSTATGLKWATPAAGGMTLISTTALSGTSTVLSSIPQTYKHLFLTFTNVTGSGSDSMQWRFNGNTSTQYSVLDFGDQNGTYTSGGAINLNRIEVSDFISTNALTGTANLYITDYTSTSATLKTISGWWMGRLNAGGNNNRFFNGRYQQTSAISSITIQSNGTVTFTGTVQLYGVS
jgi:hypothetical protein